VTLSEILSFSGECLEFLSIAKGSAGIRKAVLDEMKKNTCSSVRTTSLTAGQRVSVSPLGELL
jgi:hypothetical protein